MDGKGGKKVKDNLLSSDLSALKEAHRLVRDDAFDEQHCDDWKVRMARRYYNKLYKEYAIIDLSRYKDGKYGLRWRTEAEVVSKKGQSVCGSKDCDLSDSLCTFELPFKYTEDSVVKRELVKICLCTTCSCKLQYSRTNTADVMPTTTSQKKRSSEGDFRDKDIEPVKNKRSRT